MVELTLRDTILDALFHDFQSAVEAHQPELSISAVDDLVVLEGKVIVSGPEGPFDSYDVRIGIPADFPWEEPVTFEVGNRIPRIADRHVFEEYGNCCLGVWEEWLLRSSDHSASSFLCGPLHDYFLSQSWFEARGEWPLGDRSHGRLGVLEAYCDLMGIERNMDAAREYLRQLARDQTKGHVTCPCGSGLRLRNCHRDKLEALRTRIAPPMARRMLERLSI